MPNNELIYPADLAHKDGCCEVRQSTNTCGYPNGVYWMPPPPPCDYPPPFPPCPPYPNPHPCPCPSEEIPVKKTSIEGKICKLSKKAAAVNRMIENLETKKKDFILKAGDTSYNFGNVDLEVENWEDGSYADTALKVLKFELSLIKTKIADLSTQLGEEIDGSGGTEGTAAGDPTDP